MARANLSADRCCRHLSAIGRSRDGIKRLEMEREELAKAAVSSSSKTGSARGQGSSPYTVNRPDEPTKTLPLATSGTLNFDA